MDGKRKLHSLSWEKLCLPKKAGGLGIVSLKHRNQALLAKWWGRCYSERGSFWNNFLASRYGKKILYDLKKFSYTKNRVPIFKAFTELARCSNVYQLINRQSFSWRLDSGETILFWEGNWHPQGILSIAYHVLYETCSSKLITVKSFCEAWQDPQLRHSLWMTDLNLIPVEIREEFGRLMRSLSMTNGKDILIWSPSKSKLTTKQFSSLLTSNRNTLPQAHYW